MTNSTVLDKNLSRLLIISLIGFWFYQWISLGTFINLDLSNFNFNLKWLLNNRNLLILILPLNLILFFLLVKKKDNNFIIFFVFFLSYFIGTINFQINLFSLHDVKTEVMKVYDNYENFYLKQLTWHLTFSLNILCTILILKNFKAISLKDNYNIIILINLSFLFLITFLIFFQKGNISTNPSYYLNIFGSNKIINSNGLSRTLLIIFIFAFCKLLVNKKKINFFLILFCFLLSYLIISNEGRLNFISIFTAILLILFLSSFSFKNKILIFVIIFLTPLLTNIINKGYNFQNGQFNILESLKVNRLFGLQGEFRGKIYDKENIVNLNSNINEKCERLISNKNEFITKLNVLTTGRVKKWQCTLKLKNNFILGNGPEYDRRIITIDEGNISTQGQDVANGALYALISGGIVGISCYLFILFKYFHMCIHLLILKEKNYLINDLFFLSSFVTVGYLIGRSFFENGFSSYGIDFLIFVPCYIFIFERFNMLESNYRNP